MAAAETIVVLETLVLIAMALVLAFHHFASEPLKKRLTLLRHRLFDHFFDGHHHYG